MKLILNIHIVKSSNTYAYENKNFPSYEIRNTFIDFENKFLIFASFIFLSYLNQREIGIKIYLDINPKDLYLKKGKIVL